MQTTLQLSYEYLRLYTNAFAFQAAISQSLSKQKDDGHSQREHLRATFDPGSGAWETNTHFPPEEEPLLVEPEA